MNSGPSLRLCCRLRRKPAGPASTTARSSTGSYAGGAIGLAHTAPTRPPGGGIGNSRRKGSGKRSFKPFWIGDI